MWPPAVYEGLSHTVIAALTLVGGFALLIISQVTGVPLQPGTLTLVTMLMSTVSGWYFGTRSALAGAQAATTAANPAPAGDAEPGPPGTAPPQH